MVDDSKHASHPKFRAFHSAVDKLLKSFETSREWADLISCLGRLNRLLSTYNQFPLIPHNIVVSKRLAQCLNPALPSGVHLKALETYEVILSRIGSERLAKDLLIHTYGVFPLFQYASIAVKPLLLDIFEKHFAPLGKELRPCLKAIILAVLPGLEEGSEHYQRTILLLSKFCMGAGEQLFYSSLWQCMMSSPQCRLQTISFVTHKLSKKDGSVEDSVFIIGKDIDIMINGFKAGLTDKNLLVQRGTLELLVNHFPLHTRILSESHIVRLLRPAVFVVLRRDMSLNRRLYAWVLGNDKFHTSSSEKFSRRRSLSSDAGDVLEARHPLRRQSTFDDSLELEKQKAIYFDKYGKKVLCSALKREFYTYHRDKSDNSKVYKVLISLLDKPEVGQPCVSELLPFIFHSLYTHVMIDYDSDSALRAIRDSPMVKTATLFLKMLEQDTIWKLLAQLTKCDASRDPAFRRTEDVEMFPELKPLQLAEFILEFIDVENDIGLQISHLPEMISNVLKDLVVNLETTPVDIVQGQLAFVRKSLAKILPAYVGSEKSPDYKLSNELNDRRASILSNISEHSASGEEKRSVENGGVGVECLFEKSSPVRLCLLKYLDLFSSLVNKFSLAKSTDSGAIETIELTILRDSFTLLVDFACFPIDSTSSTRECELTCSTLSPWLRAVLSCFESGHIAVFLSALNTYLDCVNLNQHYLVADSAYRAKENEDGITFSSMLSREEFTFLNENVVFYESACKKLWSLLSFPDKDICLQVVVLMVRLHEVIPSHVMETIIASDIIGPDKEKKVIAFHRFTLFWQLSTEVYENTNIPREKHFSRALFMMLDCLSSTDPTLFFLTKCFLQEGLKDIPRFMDPFFFVLMMPTSQREISEESGKPLLPCYNQVYDTDQILYILSIISKCLECEGEAFVSGLILSEVRSGDIERMNLEHEEPFEKQPNDILSKTQLKSYFHLLVLRLLRFMQTEIDHSTRLEAIKTPNQEVQALSAVVLASLLSRIQIDKTDEGTFPIKMLKLLRSQGEFPRYLRSIEAIALDKLSNAVSTGNEILQVRILEVLRFVIVTSDCEYALALEMTSAGEGLKKLPKPALTISSSPLFLVTILSALENENFQQSHKYWIQFIARSLPYMKGMLKNLIVSVVICVCGLLKRLPPKQDPELDLALDGFAFEQSVNNHSLISGGLPSYTISVLSGLQEIVDFCLRDKSPTVDDAKVNDRMGEFLSIFSSHSSLAVEDEIESPSVEARMGVLSVLPNILEALIHVWGDISLRSLLPKKKKKKGKSTGGLSKLAGSLQPPSSSEAMGSRYVYHQQKKVRELITSIIEPFLKRNIIQLLGGIAMVWDKGNLVEDSRERETISSIHHRRTSSTQDISVLLLDMSESGQDWKRKTLCASHEDQLKLLDLFASIDGVSPAHVVKAVHKIFSQSIEYNASSSLKKNKDHRDRFPEQGLFQFFYGYLDTCSKTSGLLKIWPDISALVKEAVQKGTCAHSLLLLIGILDVYSLRVAKTQFFSDRKNRKDFQEIVQKALDACNVVISNGLKAVKSFKPSNPPHTIGGRLLTAEDDIDRRKKSDTSVLIEYMYDCISVFTITLLPLLDRIFIVEEKDRIASLLLSLIGNISIILRNKSAHNRVSCEKAFEFLNVCEHVHVFLPVLEA